MSVWTPLKSCVMNERFWIGRSHKVLSATVDLTLIHCGAWGLLTVTRVNLVHFSHHGGKLQGAKGRRLAVHASTGIKPVR